MDFTRSRSIAFGDAERLTTGNGFLLELEAPNPRIVAVISPASDSDGGARRPPPTHHPRNDHGRYTTESHACSAMVTISGALRCNKSRMMLDAARTPAALP
jgi:hypothetical protein